MSMWIFELFAGSGSGSTLQIGLDIMPLLAVLRARDTVAIGVAGSPLRTRSIG